MKFSRLEYHSTKSGSHLQTFKHDVLENLGLQISGTSRKMTQSMLVSTGVQHSHLHQVLLPVLPFRPFVDTLLPWPDHSHSCHKELELLILSAQECMVTSRIFQSSSFFRFLTVWKTKAEICWSTFCQIR